MLLTAGCSCMPVMDLYPVAQVQIPSDLVSYAAEPHGNFLI